MHTGEMWSGAVLKLMQPPGCQPVFLHDWPAGRLPIFFSFSPCHSSLILLFMLNLSSLQPLSPLVVPLHINPTPHLSLHVYLCHRRRKRIFFFFLQATSHSQMVPELQGVTARLEVEIFAVPLPHRHAKEPAVGGWERTDPCLCFLMREKSYITVPPRLFFFSVIYFVSMFDWT